MNRIGLGYDIHPFSDQPNRLLRLGGIEFPGARGLDGHSDADVVLHAVADAILGAAGLGDIGEHFPPSEQRWKDADSRELLRRSLDLVEDAFNVVNVDLTIIAEQPRIAARRDEMVESIASVLRLDSSKVNVKATTNEQMGAIGRGEGIAALAVALLEGR